MAEVPKLQEQISAGKSSQNHLRVTSLNLRMLGKFGGSPTRLLSLDHHGWWKCRKRRSSFLPNTSRLKLKISCASQRDLMREEEVLLFGYNGR